MTLNPMCDNVETKQGVPLTVTGVAQVKIMKDPQLLEIAAEQFLGKKEDEITETILQTLEGHLRAILGTPSCSRSLLSSSWARRKMRLRRQSCRHWRVTCELSLVPSLWRKSTRTEISLQPWSGRSLSLMLARWGLRSFPSPSRMCTTTWTISPLWASPRLPP